MICFGRTLTQLFLLSGECCVALIRGGPRRLQPPLLDVVKRAQSKGSVGVSL